MPVLDLSVALDALVDTDPGALADPETMVELRAQAARLDAVIATATARFDADRHWEVEGAKTASAWIATSAGLPKQAARRQVRLGRELRHLPAAQSAWLAGTITADHVGALAAVRRPATEDALRRDEKMLVDHATSLRYEQFVKVVEYWAQQADPDGAEDDDNDRRRHREVHLSESFRGMWLGKMTFDPISGTIVHNELSRLERDLFEADWAEAKARLGREPTLADLARTPAQRRADAFVEMAVRSASMPADARRPAPLFSVFVDYETFQGRLCQLAGGTVLSPGALIPWLDAAYIERAVFSPQNRVEVSHRARLFTGATRRAVELRDRECFNKFCDTPGAYCQVDHIVGYEDGGLTTQENGQLACGYHNRRKYADGRRAAQPPGPSEHTEPPGSADPPGAAERPGSAEPPGLAEPSEAPRLC